MALEACPADILCPRSMQKQMFDLLEGWLRHKSDMVNYEAARAICEMRNVTAQQLTRSIAGASRGRSSR
jgi:hypothetical protein